MKTVKKTKQGHIKIKLTQRQFGDFLDLIDCFPEYQKNSQYTPLHRVWMIVLQKMKDRYMVPILMDDHMTVTLRIEEAVIIDAYWVKSGHLSNLNLKAEMMEVNRLLLD